MCEHEYVLYEYGTHVVRVCLYCGQVESESINGIPVKLIREIE